MNLLPVFRLPFPGIFPTLLFSLAATFLPLSAQTIPSPHLTPELRSEIQTKDGFRNQSGDVQTARFGTSLRYWQPLGPAFFGTVTSSFDFFTYDIKGLSPDPGFTLDDASRLMLQLELFQFPRQRFGYFAFAQASEASAAEGTFGRGLTVFGTGGFMAKINDSLTAGLGIAYGGNILDRPTVFPVPVIFWQIDENWRLTTRNGLIISRRQDSLTFSGEAFYLNRQFALGRTDGQSRGVLEDTGVRVGAKTTWQSDNFWQVELGLFSYVWREIKVRREDRTQIFKEKVDPGLSLKLAVSKRF